MIRHVLAVIVVASCASCGRTPGGAEARLDWHPEIDEPIRQLEEVLATTQQQQPMNYTISNIAFLYDTKLYILFRRYVDSLPEERRAAPVDEQRLWLDERERVSHLAYAEHEGGSISPFLAARAHIDATKARIAEIERRLGRGEV